MDKYFDIMMSTMDAVTHPEKVDEVRKDALTDNVGDQIVDTTDTTDTHIWETGICRKGGWIIVEQYDSKEEAYKGHRGWVERLTTDPAMELKDIDIFGVNDYDWDENDDEDD